MHSLLHLLLVCTCRFTIGLLQNTEGNEVFHLSMRFNWNGYEFQVTVLNSMVNSVWQTETHLMGPENPFPFVVDQQFQLKITASGLNQLDVSQDSTQLSN